jgi:hypothetical protein
LPFPFFKELQDPITNFTFRAQIASGKIELDTLMFMPIERSYLSVTSEWGLMGSLSYVTAEARAVGGRQHRRIIANSPLKPVLHGKPLFYADTYLAKDQPTIYAYARHKSEPRFFFEVLSRFYDEVADDYELGGKEFRLVLNRDGELSEGSVRFPFASWSDLKGLKFCRIFLPVGDIAIEFSSIASKAGDQLEGCVKRKELTKTLERPLIGCDLSRTPVLATLMARLHWASDFVPPAILERLAGQLAGNTVPA